ncbi:MAG: NEW3 domain-containing protein [Armatimonadota bacterium]|nr:NEW3 domain-containing protein [Armatimonadota bacterium]
MTKRTIPQKPTLQSRRQVTVGLETSDLILLPGEPTVVQAILTNEGSETEDVTLGVEGVPENWVQTPAWALQVPPGESVKASLTVMAPRSAESRSGIYPVDIHAQSADSTPLGSGHTVWSVQNFAESSLEINPPAAGGGSGARYAVLLRNEGNDTAWYSLSAVDDGGLLYCNLAPAQVALDNGQSAEIRLTVSGPRRWIGSPISHSIRVRAVASGVPGEFAKGPAEAARTATAQFIHRCLLPGWLLQLAVVLIAVAGVGAGVLMYLSQDAAALVDARRSATRDADIARVDAEGASHQANIAKDAYKQADQVATQADHSRELAQKLAAQADTDRDDAKRNADLADMDRLYDAANTNVADQDRDAAARNADLAERARDDTRQAADSCDHYRNDADKTSKFAAGKAAQAREAAAKAQFQADSIHTDIDRASARNLAEKASAFSTEAADDQKQAEEQASQARVDADAASQASKDAFNHYHDVKVAATATSADAKAAKSAYHAAEGKQKAAIELEKAKADHAALLERQALQLQQQEQELAARQTAQQQALLRASQATPTPAP